MTEHRYSLEQIDAIALPRARALCAALFGETRLASGNIWMHSPTRQDPNFTSFSFNERSGVWKDFGGALGGGKGCLSLVAAVLGGGSASPDWKRAIPWLKDFLGLSDRAPSKIETEHLKREIAARETEKKAHAEAQLRKARGLWLHGTPLDGTDPASLYLLGRGIDVRALLGGIPRALRFHPSVWASDSESNFRGPYPCMLGAIARYGEGIVAVHRTYLHEEPNTLAPASLSSRWVKCTWPNCKTGKQVKGAYAGGYIALSRGSSGKPLREIMAHDEHWPCVHEGIEDALTGALVKPELRHIAAVSISTSGGLCRPPQVKGVLIVKQNDSDPATLKQFDDAMDRLCARGIEPAIVEIDARFKDINDAHCGISQARAGALADEKVGAAA